ncbi:hypothetical protein WICPIJ_007968 [Wickerhamomyces pijperi]|uniref:Uncharacterized protein n=1 Tax=Wickerhamomyces pijperi TaxID=599730 RepID=A0A9P8Q1D8_WICPI|nr:hypothetical protein WICPIJ_007968 [Wickerhamomyces pijperi]
MFNVIITKVTTIQFKEFDQKNTQVFQWGDVTCGETRMKFEERVNHTDLLLLTTGLSFVKSVVLSPTEKTSPSSSEESSSLASSSESEKSNEMKSEPSFKEFPDLTTIAAPVSIFCFLAAESSSSESLSSRISSLFSFLNSA